MPIKLIVGLRNPGSAYASTRHNAGAWLVEALAQSKQLQFKSDKKLGSDWLRFDYAPAHCVLMMPLNFMNGNGVSVRALSQFYDILPHEILIVHDDLDLQPGDLRLKTAGGHGGHNGLRDVIAQLQSNEFHRLRIGIGHPGHKTLVSDYVLSKPSAIDKEKIQCAIARGLNELSSIISGNFAVAMNRLHSGG